MNRSKSRGARTQRRKAMLAKRVEKVRLRITKFFNDFENRPDPFAAWETGPDSIVQIEQNDSEILKFRP